MKIRKLLKIILIAPTYLVVEENGSNQIIHTDTKNKKVGDFFEIEHEIEEQKIKDDSRKERKEEYVKKGDSLK